MKKLIWFLVVLPIVAVLTFVMVSSLSDKLIRSFKATAQDKQEPESERRERLRASEQARSKRIDKMPEIVLETPSLEVSAEVKFLYEYSDFLVLHVRNKSAKAVVNLTVCTRIDDSWRTGISFAAGEAVPPEYILPYGEKTVEISPGNIEPGHPVTLCAVTFSDGSQEGLPEQREDAKKFWEREKKRRGLPR